MTCDAIAALLWRFLGIVIILIVLPAVLPGFLSVPTAFVSGMFVATIGLSIGALFIVFSKPLGHFIAAGLG